MDEKNTGEQLINESAESPRSQIESKEDDMSEAEARYRSLEENTWDMMYSIAPDTSIVSLNPAFEKITGWSRAEWLGRSFQPLLHPDELSRGIDAFQHILRGETLSNIQFRILSKSGEYKLMEFTTIAPQVYNGKVIGLSGIARDITERKQMEEELRSSSLYARSLIEASIDPLVTINHDGKITDVNKATELATGITREQLIGSDFSNYFTEPEKARKGYQNVIERGSVKDYPLTIRHKSGHTTDVLYNATVYRNKEGEIQGIFAAARDITERKKADEALSKAREELEIRVDERTAQLKKAKEALRSEIREKELASKKLKRSKELSDALNIINYEINSTLDFESIINRALAESVNALGTENAMVLIREGNFWVTKFTYQIHFEAIGKKYSDDELPLVSQVSRTRKSLAINDICSGVMGLMKKYGARSGIIVPLIARDEVIGVISFSNISTAATFSKAEIDFAEKLGASVSLAIENANLFENIKKTKEELNHIEWLLKKKPPSIREKTEPYTPPYSDLLELNKSRVLLDSIGENMLFDIVSDFLDLLGTSSSVYEKNGDYALGIFSSGYCRFLDSASRNLCNTEDNTEALKSGKWHCHESCWTEAAKISIEKGEPVDIECRGGIRLHAVPIKAGKEIIGSINIGYGDPPEDPEKLQQIAERYGVRADKLQELSSKYESRPLFIIEIAKNRLLTSAKLIGEIVQRKRAEEEQKRLLADLQKEHQQVEELAMSLKSKRDALQVIMQNTEAQLAYLDSNFNFIMVNSAYAKGSGHTVDELIGKNHFEIFPSAENKALFKKVRDSGKAISFKARPFEYPDQPHRGVTYWDWTLTPVKGASGNVDRLVLSLVEVTERIKSETALKRSLAFAESIVDTLRVPIVILDKQMNVKTANQAFHRTFKVSIEDTKDRTFFGLCNGLLDTANLRYLLEKVIAKNIDVSGFDVDMDLPVTGRKKMQIGARQIHRKGAHPELILVSFLDITDRKKMDELYLETERLIYANKSKSEFLNMMGHELRTPLTSIVGYSILLNSTKFGELNKKQKHYVEGVLASSKHLLDLINNVLELGKLEAGKTELNIEEISIPNILNETINLFKDNATMKNIVLKKELDPALRTIEADRLKFKQILFNLLSNAIKFSKKDGGTVTISAKKDDNATRISVSDSGIGIRKKDIPRLFQKFEQLDRGLSRKYQGTGLGLAITKQLVELHNGIIMVDSKYGKGSTFTFMIPLSLKKLKKKRVKRLKKKTRA